MRFVGGSPRRPSRRGPWTLTGFASLVGRMLHVELHEAASGAPMYITAFLPGRPASVLCGIASGATLMGGDPQPSATRFVLVRAPALTAGELRHTIAICPWSRPRWART